MKLMNDIESEYEGDDCRDLSLKMDRRVEYGQPLFRISIDNRRTEYETSGISRRIEANYSTQTSISAWWIILKIMSRDSMPLHINVYPIREEFFAGTFSTGTGNAGRADRGGI